MSRVARDWRRLYFLVIFGVLVSLSVTPRLVNLDKPLLEKNAFRQTQTAFTARTFMDSGIEPLNYKTPLFGPPWQVPFEFPLFQSVVAGVSVVGLEGSSFDIACRVTAMFFFYLSAALLFLVCREFMGLSSNLWVLAVYLLAPFSIIYSRMCLIDYTSVALVLAYILAVIKWSKGHFRLFWLALATAFGSLAALVKIATVAMAIPAILILSVSELRRVISPLANRSPIRRPILQSAPTVAQIAAFIILPASIAVLWVWHTDQIKASSMFTEWLTSKELDHWNWGTQAQRLDWRNWAAILTRWFRLMAPGGIALAPFIAMAGFTTQDKKYRLAVLASLAGLGLPVLLFFNLYVVHEYYLIAVAAPSAVLVGVGLSTLSGCDRLGPRPLRIVVLVLLLFALPTAFLKQVWPSVMPFDQRHRDLDVARVIRSGTEPGARVAMTQASSNWDSTIPYYSQRSFCILRGTMNDPAIDGFLVEHGFRYAVLHRANPLRLTNWNKTRIASAYEYDLYSIDYRYAGVDCAGFTPNGVNFEPVNLFSLSGPDLVGVLVPVHQVEIHPFGQTGVAIIALGDDPVLLLPLIEFPKGHRIEIEIDLESPLITELKVYFTTRSTPEYSEELRVRAPLEKGRNNLRLAIVHPGVEGSLRLDPGTATGRFVIYELKVVGIPVPEGEV